MTRVQMSSEIEVDLVRALAHDDYVIQAAQVSVTGINKPETDSVRLINYLMESRHGSPFEHNALTFSVQAPIFVFREWQRHRISSFNEMSGRYTKLKPKFYSPGLNRKLINVGSSARPEFAHGTIEQLNQVNMDDIFMAQTAWDVYEGRIENGIANEIARTVLPVSVYSEMYWTVNARSLMNFLSLRIDSPDSLVRSRPQYEIQQGAYKVEEEFKRLMPITHAAFVKHGRVAP